MFATIRGTRLYVDIEGAGLFPDGPVMRERPVAFIINSGPGTDHSGFKPVMSPLSNIAQLVYFDHRGQGRSGRADPDADPARFTLDQNVEDMEAVRHHQGVGPIVSVGAS
jgi:proline iminopeptidase